MKTLQARSSSFYKRALSACLLVSALVMGVSGFGASAPTPYIEASRMQYQLENQSFTLMPTVPAKNRVWTEGGNNSDYAYINTSTWEVSTNGSTWRKIGTDVNDASLYTDNYSLTIHALKTNMSGWKYRATVEVCYDNGQSKSTLVTALVTLDVKPSFLKCPTSLAFDAAGNLYVADMLTNAIWKINPANVVSVFAGSAAGDAGTQNGAGTLARFDRPRGIAFQGGKLYVADSGNNAIRTITLDGTVATLAGMPGRSGSYLEGTGTTACFDRPTALTVDSSGNVYVVDTGNNVIRKITPAGVTSHIAGEQYTASIGLSGSCNTTTAGGVVTINGGIGMSGTTRINDVIPVYGNSGTLTLINTSTLGITTTGSLPLGGGITIGGGGYSFGAQGGGGLVISGSSLFRSPDYITSTTLTLSETTPFASMETLQPYYFHGALGITLSSDNRFLYVADSGSDVIVKIALSDGAITTLDIDFKGISGDPLADEYTKPTSPAGLRIDSNNNIYFADAYSSRIVKVAASGSAQVVAGLSNWLWGYQTQLYTVYPNSFEDGAANEALFNIPSDIAIDTAGSIYVADSENAAIRKITQSGTTVTVSTLLLQAAPSGNNTGNGSTNNSTDSGGGGGGAPSVWYLLVIGALVGLRLRRR